MHLSANLLGTSTAVKIAERATSPLLVIGKDIFLRRDLAQVDCFNFLAAATLSAQLRALKVHDTRDVFERVPPAALVLPRVGAVALAVLGAAFEARGLGGDQPLDAWYVKHRAKEFSKEFVTFHTLKAQAHSRDAGVRKADRAAKARRAARRDQAQRIRGQRYIERHAGA